MRTLRTLPTSPDATGRARPEVGDRRAAEDCRGEPHRVTEPADREATQCPRFCASRGPSKISRLGRFAGRPPQPERDSCATC